MKLASQVPYTSYCKLTKYLVFVVLSVQLWRLYNCPLSQNDGLTQLCTAGNRLLTLVCRSKDGYKFIS